MTFVLQQILTQFSGDLENGKYQASVIVFENANLKTRLERIHCLGISFFFLLLWSGQTPAGEPLYNGIVLPDQWPPKMEHLELVEIRDPLMKIRKLEFEPMEVPYLKKPPKVIPIDVGRQLFVDDFLIEQTTMLRKYHQAVYHPACPVVRPDKPWEASYAMVYSDGVWYDPADELFKMWYYAGGKPTATCYAYSKDGIHWQKPELDFEPGTNVVVRQQRDSSLVWLDLDEQDPARRFKRYAQEKRNDLVSDLHDPSTRYHATMRFSPDGIRWSDAIAMSDPPIDRSTFFYNPFRDIWVYSIRTFPPRARAYREVTSKDLTSWWKLDQMAAWVGADRLDPRNPNPQWSDVTPELYNVDAVAYESLMLGAFSIWQGPPYNERVAAGIRKRSEVLLGFSRDGFHWHRPSRKPFLAVNEDLGSWNWGNVQSSGGVCLVVGDKLYFYCSGRAIAGERTGGSTGVAILRRDGFASMLAGAKQRTLTTRAVTFKGKYLFVNADTNGGLLEVEVLDKDGKVIEPLTRENCHPISVDKTLTQVRWKGTKDLSHLAGEPVKFCFYLSNGHLYSFWVSPDKSGASYGYVAAGGPGFDSTRDTVGSAAYEHGNRR